MTRDEEEALVAFRWAQLREKLGLTPAQAAAIDAVHRELRFDCCGYAEGQWCCLDRLTGAQ